MLGREYYTEWDRKLHDSYVWQKGMFQQVSRGKLTVFGIIFGGGISFCICLR